eukprot:CAMPEP_0176101552 /NCGR_PEP_ID=MMETSP0120_2-20121206/50935_1 /TAXON_ID=160619 /ORGANISM="Kryptoperidinium foliaceum, Strain CCMP 1326" /LENGTH=101 /DNA_ID=CAMNT_0017435603 /DNA_START=359 /DNA_END=661 /DNA_ORIENTATION=+
MAPAVNQLPLVGGSVLVALGPFLVPHVLEVASGTTLCVRITSEGPLPRLTWRFCTAFVRKLRVRLWSAPGRDVALRSACPVTTHGCVVAAPKREVAASGVT